MSYVMTVFVKPDSEGHCPQCTRAKHFLDNLGQPYQVSNVRTDSRASDIISRHGVTQAPIVAVFNEDNPEDVSFSSGFRPQELKELSQLYTDKNAEIRNGSSREFASVSAGSDDIWDF